MVALVQFPTVVDMMCVEMDWTTELGSAFLADEPGVLDAVQVFDQQVGPARGVPQERPDFRRGRGIDTAAFGPAVLAAVFGGR